METMGLHVQLLLLLQRLDLRDSLVFAETAPTPSKVTLVWAQGAQGAPWSPHGVPLGPLGVPWGPLGPLWAPWAPHGARGMRARARARVSPGLLFPPECYFGE